MYTEVLRDCGNQIRRYQITFPLLPFLIHGTHLACFLVLFFTRFFRLAANTSLERRNSSSWRILKDSFNSLRWHCMLFWKLEILSHSYSPPFCFFFSLKNLPRSLSRVAAGTFITLKSPLTCCSQKALKSFHSYVVFFTVFDDLSAAMKLSSSYLDILVNFEISLAVFIPNTPRNSAISYTNTPSF